MMGQRIAGAFLGAVIAVGAGAAWAEDVALIIGNADYRRMPGVQAASDAVDAAGAFEDAGFRVFSARNADARDLGQLLDRFVPAAAQADRVVVVLNGIFLHSSEESWLLPVDTPEAPLLGQVARIGVALSTVYPVLAAHPGRAVLVAGSDGRSSTAFPYLDWGVRFGDIPQGVTTFTGKAQATSWFVTTALSRQGINLTDAARKVEGISSGGFFPTGYMLLPDEDSGTATPVPLPDPDPKTEAVFWDATRKADTVAAYEAYLRRYPNGPHADQAKALIKEIQTEPNRDARLVEDALNLSRDQRREIQRALSLLGHDPRGIDGIFGPGSRAAITEWQTVNGFDRTGYLTRDQISKLSSQAEARAAELERQAEERRRETERQDRAYWEQTGAVGDEAGLRSYLDKYPDGIFADIANERLKAIEDANRQKAAAQERAQWDAARELNTVAAYEDYLQRYPKGTFAEEAQGRIRQLKEDQQGAAERQQAQQQEEALGLNNATRLLIERRLDALGLQPGKVDGVFDEDTRRALRRYQDARGLRPTGYMNEGTVVRLLADAFGGN